MPKNNAENEGKIKIIPYTDFYPNVNYRVKLFYAWISSMTKCRVVFRVTADYFRALGPRDPLGKSWGTQKIDEMEGRKLTGACTKKLFLS